MDPSDVEDQSPLPVITDSLPSIPVNDYGTINRTSTNTMRPRFMHFVKRLILVFFPSWTFSKFFVSAIIPPLADNIIPLFFTGNIPDESALALAGQFIFISIILEVIQEGVVNSLFHFVGKSYDQNRLKALQAFKLSLAILLVLGSLLTLAILLLTPQFVKVIDTPESIAEATRTFLYTSSFSFPMFLLNAAFNNYLLITTSSFIVVSQFTSVVFSFCINLFLFGVQDWSFHWGIESLGHYKVIQATVNLTISFVFFLIVEKINPFYFIVTVPLLRDLRSNFRVFFNVSWGNFGDSAIRNFFYFMVTLKFVNNLGEDESGAWNLLNSIVWGLLLVPCYAVANYVKVEVGHESNRTKVRKIAKESALCVFAWLLIISVVAGSMWPRIAEFFGKSNQDVQNLSTTMFYHVGWIFIVFACNNAMDGLFFGTGQTQYVFYQSLITNMVVYFVPWILYLFDILQPTYWWVVGLYIGGMLVDFCLTSYFCFLLWKSIPE
jgi:Na+-driven multidrug efflux pump